MDQQTFQRLMLCDPFTGPSVEAFASHLGLEEPAVFAKRRGYGRASGRTTEMLLEAAVAMAQGKKVALAAHSYAYGDQLIAQLRSMASALQLDLALLDRQPAYATSDRSSVERWSRGRRPGDPPLVFQDHYRARPAGPSWRLEAF